MIYLHWLALVLYSAIIILVMVRILMEHRQPTKTMAWLLVLLFVPVLGIILYIFFGQNTRKEKYISRRSLSQLAKRQNTHLSSHNLKDVSEEVRDVVHLFYNQNGALPFISTDVEIYTQGSEFFLGLLQQIGKARESIHLETYIFEDDALGTLVADCLIDKAREGVEVRLIYDDVGCWNVRNRFFEKMRGEGIDVHAFIPVRFPAFTSKVNYRNHRKLCIVDGKVAFIGGMNIALRYVKGKNGVEWRDTHLKIQGDAVHGIQFAFLVDWYFVDRTLITDKKYYASSANDVALSGVHRGFLSQVVVSSPVQRWPDIEQGYVRILLQAKRYVYMESPYFLPTESILFALRVAALAGVDVRIMIPLHSDNKVLDWASRSFIMEILQAGVKVLLYKKGFNHSKLLVSDDLISTCGSTNLDVRSFENNFEANIFFYDAVMAKRIKNVFLMDEEKAVDVRDVVELSHRSFWGRLWESIVRLLSPLL